MTQPLPDQGQYAQIFDALASKYPDLKKADGQQGAFQFSAAPIEAAWMTGGDYEAYATANTVSQHLGGYYVPGPGSLTTAYRDLIHSIEPADHNDNPRWAELMGKRADFRRQRTAKEDQMMVAYTTYKQQTPTPQTAAQWEADPMGGLQYAEELADIKAQISELDQEITAVVGSLDAALADAQAALNDPQFQQNYKTPDGGVAKHPSIDISGNLGDDRGRWDNYASTEYDFQATLKGRAETATPWRTVYDTEVKHECLSTSVSTEVSTSRIIADEEYSIQVFFKGLQAYPIRFGDWYHGSYVNPGTAKFPDGGTVNGDTFFGADGSLHMTPDVIWVAYRPKFVITVSTQLFKQQFSAEAVAQVDWIDLFGFRFGVDGLASLKPEGDERTTTITIDSPTAQNPTVLGMMSSVHFNGKP